MKDDLSRILKYWRVVMRLQAFGVTPDEAMRRACAVLRAS